MEATIAYYTENASLLVRIKIHEQGETLCVFIPRGLLCQFVHVLILRKGW